MKVQWYPGHMAKATRLMKEQLKTVDIVIEVCDARAPLASRNDVLSSALGGKKRIVAYNKSTLADKQISENWMAHLTAGGELCVFTDAMAREGIKQLRELLIDEAAGKMRYNRAVRAMVTGIPNVGKSMLINSLTFSSGVKTGNRPGLTRGNQWLRIDEKLHLLDTPGVLAPKIESDYDAFCLAAIGCVKDTIFDKYEACIEIVDFMRRYYPALLLSRYKLEAIDDDSVVVLEDIARRRGFFMRGGEVDLNRLADTLYDEFKNGKIGRMSLQCPEEK